MIFASRSNQDYYRLFQIMAGVFPEMIDKRSMCTQAEDISHNVGDLEIKQLRIGHRKWQSLLVPMSGNDEVAERRSRQVGAIRDVTERRRGRIEQHRVLLSCLHDVTRSADVKSDLMPPLHCAIRAFVGA
jgi:hypothetical protein